MEVEAGFEEAQEKITPTIEPHMKYDIGGDVQRIYSMQMNTMASLSNTFSYQFRLVFFCIMGNISAF